MILLLCKYMTENLHSIQVNIMVLIHELIGSFGKYQLWICSLIFLNKFGVAFHQMAIIFLAPPVIYYCPGTNSTCCDNPVYNKTVFSRTIVTEWNLICENSWLKDLNQTIFQFGVSTGSMLCGMASDRFGRRQTLMVCVIMEVFMGLMVSFLPYYWLFTLVRMVLGFAIGGIMVVGFVMVMEYVGHEYRDVVSALYHVPFATGHILLALFGYLIRDYVYFQLGISLANVFLLTYICILPESPRWLLAVNRTIEAVTMLERIAKINNLPVESVEEKVNLYQLNVCHHAHKITPWDLYRTPNLRKNILVMSFIWLVSSYYFYGVSHYICHYSGDLYINVAATGGSCLFACIIAIPITRYMRRRTVVITSFVGCSVCLILLALISDCKTSIIIGWFGLLFGCIVMIVAYLYCSELFPTAVRNAAVGIAAMMARFGSMIAPFVVSLKAYGNWCAPLAFAVFPLAAAVSCYWLPETKDCELMMTLEDGEAFGTNKTKVRVEAATSNVGVTESLYSI